LLSEGQFSPSDAEPALAFEVMPVIETHDGGVPTIRTVPDGNSVLIDVVQNDVYKGLGGIRVPLVLEVKAADTQEQIYAQKLMPYTCKFLPEMTQNVQPTLPGITLNGAEWPEVGSVTLSGREKHEMNAVDFSASQETYVLPSLQLKPVALTESWKIAHYATSGTTSPYETGGTNLGGGLSKSAFSWTPSATAHEPLDVTFYFVVRDGRGGESWLLRHARWSP
jgi:hypothetical protein